MTVGALLDEISQLFVNKGFEKPRREALLLLSDVTGDPVGFPLSHPEASVAPPHVDAARAAAHRRAAGAPLPYATGIAHFRALRLVVDRRVLIPRPETEGLVDRVLAWQASRGGGGVAVDVGTGSGCVALSLAQEGAFGTVVGIDRSHHALRVARVNGARAGLVVRWLLGDLASGVRPGEAAAVVSNPPYVTAAEWEGLAPGVRDWEPRMALVAADDGMALIAGLVTQAYACLTPGGLLAVEVDSTRADAARALAVHAGFGSARIEDDLFGRPRYLMASKES